jgi:hypothetical protein
MVIFFRSEGIQEPKGNGGSTRVGAVLRHEALQASICMHVLVPHFCVSIILAISVLVIQLASAIAVAMVVVPAEICMLVMIPIVMVIMTIIAIVAIIQLLQLQKLL